MLQIGYMANDPMIILISIHGNYRKVFDISFKLTNNLNDIPKSVFVKKATSECHLPKPSEMMVKDSKTALRFSSCTD